MGGLHLGPEIYWTRCWLRPVGQVGHNPLAPRGPRGANAWVGVECGGLDERSRLVADGQGRQDILYSTLALCPNHHHDKAGDGEHSVDVWLVHGGLLPLVLR